jgi:hypothetical protein
MNFRSSDPNLTMSHKITFKSIKNIKKTYEKNHTYKKIVMKKNN